MATRPWFSPYREQTRARETYLGIDHPSRVYACLSCNLPVCVDCFSHKAHPKCREICKFLFAGKRPSQIANALGVSLSAVEALKRRLEGEDGADDD